MKKTAGKFIAGVLSVSLALTIGGCSENKQSSPLDPSNPTTITIWNYYNGDQLTAFENLVTEFNNSVGAEEGIAVVSVSQGSIDNLADSLLESVQGKVGAQDVPNLASVYSETAFILNESDQIVPMDSYFTEEELAEYIPGFIEEGRLAEGGELYLFPISKSTECFAVNVTDWVPFEDACGISVDSITSYEELTNAAEKYYQWTDSLTPDVYEDGKALYGVDSVPNYIYLGTYQLGQEMFKVTSEGLKVNLDREAFKTLWDNYYIPYINGYFSAVASHRSDDMKTLENLAVTCSSSGVNYLPTAVTDLNDVSHDIEIAIKEPLSFENGNYAAVSQGAGYCILKGSDAETYASVEFLKWFSDSERNLQFSVNSGYSPVSVEANGKEKITAEFDEKENSAKNTNILTALLNSSDVFLNKKTYSSNPFSGSKEVRALLDTMMSDTAVNDRAAVVEAMSQGKSREEAVEAFSTDEYFESWFEELKNAVNEIIQ